ncbi:MAG: hypothetical protein OIF50_04945 [Flavobacteriaceae bacterium]|nr:hypothetical protein [Flavobacteriaceae bacterium]
MKGLNQHKINVLQSLLDEFATIGVISCPYDKRKALEVAQTLIDDYPYSSANSNTKKADNHIYKASYYIGVGLIQPYGFQKYIELTCKELETALSLLID